MADKGELNLTTNINECTVCRSEVKQKDKAINCDICMVWYHTECVKISQANYTAVKKINSTCQGFKWLCTKCDSFFGRMVSDLNEAVEIQGKVETRCVKLEKDVLTLEKSFSDLKESIIRKNEELQGNTNKELADMKIYVDKIMSGKGPEDKSVNGKVEEELGEIRDQLGDLRLKYSEAIKVGLDENQSSSNRENIAQNKTIQLEIATEAIERDKRKNNLVIFGIEETGDIEATKEKVARIVEIVGINQEKVKYFGRVGRVTTGGRVRIVRVICEDPETRRKLLMGANKLRAVEGYERTYIAPDLTKEQQVQDKTLRDKLKVIRIQYKDAKINNGEIVISENGSKKILFSLTN